MKTIIELSILKSRSDWSVNNVKSYDSFPNNPTAAFHYANRKYANLKLCKLTNQLLQHGYISTLGTHHYKVGL